MKVVWWLVSESLRIANSEFVSLVYFSEKVSFINWFELVETNNALEQVKHQGDIYLLSLLKLRASILSSQDNSVITHTEEEK